MPRALLLRTERPVLLPREQETHDWFEEYKPWVSLDLEYYFDNYPGDWRHYSRVFHDAWKMARGKRLALLNVESDIVPTLDAFRAVLECPEMLCMVPYQLFHYKTGALLGHSATTETRVPGGWDAHLAREGEPWAEYGDLGFIRFSARLVLAYDMADVPDLQYDNGLLNEAIFTWLRRVWRKEKLIHLHWPALKNNHYTWDRGDSAHHPGGHPNDALLSRPQPTP